MIFVFGSNESGIHGAGAARTAVKVHGAEMYKSYGHYGNSFAIPTKDQNIQNSLDLKQIRAYVQGFIAYAHGHPEWEFQVTRIGCGLAGLPEGDMAMMFWEAPRNCYMDSKWQVYFGDDHNYWGTF